MRTIDLAGPDGNVFHLAGRAETWNKQLGNNRPSLLQEANSRPECYGYEGVLDIFDEWFEGIDYEFINDPRDPETWEDDDCE